MVKQAGIRWRNDAPSSPVDRHRAARSQLGQAREKAVWRALAT